MRRLTSEEADELLVGIPRRRAIGGVIILGGSTSCDAWGFEAHGDAASCSIASSYATGAREAVRLLYECALACQLFGEHF